MELLTTWKALFSCSCTLLLVPAFLYKEQPPVTMICNNIFKSRFYVVVKWHSCRSSKSVLLDQDQTTHIQIGNFKSYSLKSTHEGSNLDPTLLICWLWQSGLEIPVVLMFVVAILDIVENFCQMTLMQPKSRLHYRFITSKHVMLLFRSQPQTLI